MTRDEATAEVQKILGYRGDKVPEIETLFRYQQNELEHEAALPWFLKFDDASLVSVAGQEFINVPARYLRATDDDALYVKEVDAITGKTRWIPLSKDTSKYLRVSLQDLVSTDGTSRPIAYSFVDDKFLLFPTPDAIYEFRMIYYRSDDVLSTDIENKWLKHLPYLLIGRAGLRVSGASGNKNALPIFATMVTEGMARVNTVSTSQDWAGSRPVVGGED